MSRVVAIRSTRSASDSEVAHALRHERRDRKLRELTACELGLGGSGESRRRTGRRGWRGSNPVYPGLHEIITQPEYDSFSVAAGAAVPSQSVLFQNPIGQSSKTLLNTNMLAAGQLPAPQKFSVRAIRLGIRNDAVPADMVSFLWGTYCVFSVSQKPYLQCPAVLLTAGFGAYLPAISQLNPVETGTASIVGYMTSNGVPDQANIYALSRPIQIEQNEQFSFTINAPSTITLTAATGSPAPTPPGTGLTTYVFLDGELSRAVN
jgi:hypothetical protein